MKFKEYKLSELSKDNKGTYGIGASAVEYSKDLYTYLRITDIKEDGSLDYKNLKSVDDKNAEKYLLKKGDIVFARTGNSTGKAYYYDGEIQNLVYAGFLIKFSLDENKVNPKFMKYYTMTKEYKNWVKEIQTGSTRGNINEKMYGNMKVKLPSRIYQDKMVLLLECIDKKIELNNQINNNLFKLIKNMYFKMQKDMTKFEIVKLKDIANISSGKRPKNKGDEYAIPLIGANGIMSYTEEYNSNSDILVIGRVGTLGVVQRYFDKIWLSDNTLIINSIYSNVLENYLKYVDYQSLNRGSTQPLITQTDISNLDIKFSKNEFDRFEKEVIKLRKKIELNNKQNKILEQLRDTLLPKLMNGEIDLIKIEV